jgi:hypothetical protein
VEGSLSVLRKAVRPAPEAQEGIWLVLPKVRAGRRTVGVEGGGVTTHGVFHGIAASVKSKIDSRSECPRGQPASVAVAHRAFPKTFTSQSLPMNRIAVTAPKGGIGKTFVACNLAFYLHQSRMQVKPCVVDFGSHCSACRYLDHSAYQKAKALKHSDFVFQTGSGLVAANCEDWDKADESNSRRQAFQDIMTDPLARTPIIQRVLGDTHLLQQCDGFIYDTDHYIRTLIKFLTSFDRVILLIDDHDDINMENLALSWIPYSNYHTGELVKKRPRKTYIIANRTANPSRAKQRLLRCCEQAFSRELPKADVELKMGEIDHFFIDQFSIPAFTQANANASFQRSLPIWEIDPNAKDVFRQLAGIVR